MNHTPIWTYDYVNGKYRLLKDHKLVVGIYADEKDAIGDMCSLLSKMQWTINDLLEALKQILDVEATLIVPNRLAQIERIAQAAIAKATQ